MIQNDRRRTNATIDHTLVVRELIATPLVHTHDLVVTGTFSIDGSIDLLNLQTINVGTGNFSIITATNITATDIIATSMTTVNLMASDIKTGTFQANNAVLTDTSNQLTMGTGQTIVVSAPTPASTRTYTMADVLANAEFIMSEGDQTINGVKTFTSTPVIPGLSLPAITLTDATNQITMGTGNTTTINSIAPVASRIYTIPDAGTDTAFIMGASAQTIGGTKTFSSAVVINTATNQLVLSGPTRTATISAVEPAGASRVYTIQDAGAAANFIMSESAQTINAAKTFTSGVVINAATNQLVLSGPTRTATISAVQPATASRTYTIPDAGADTSFIMGASTQTIGGSKTFSSAVAITPVSNQLVLGTTNTITINAAAPGASRTYTMANVGFDCDFVMTSGAQTLDGLKTFNAGAVFGSTAIFDAGFTTTFGTFTSASGQITFGTFPNLIILSAPTPAVGFVATIEDVGINSSVVLSSRSTETQATDITTAVTLNAPSGVITTQTTTAASGATQTFTVNNTVCFSTSVVLVDLHQYSGTYLTNGIPYVRVTTVADGSFNISVINIHGTNALNGTLVLHFLVC